MFKKSLLLFLLLVFLILPINVLAIGQMTKPIVIQDAQRGAEYEEVVTIVNNENNQVRVELEAKGEIKNWVKFYLPNDLNNEINDLNVNALQNQNVVAVFSVASDMANGEYKGSVVISKVPEEMSGVSGSSVSVRQEIGREVIVMVGGEENAVLSASVIPKKYSLKKNENLEMRFVYNNLGNVSLKPSIDLKIKNVVGEVVYNAIYPYRESEMSVRPNAQYEIKPISVSTSGWAKGSYRAEFAFRHNQQVLDEKMFRFSIGQTGMVLGISDWKINWWIISLGFVFILFVIGMHFLKKKRTV